MQRVRLVVVGIVQGVGFRPFIHRLVTEYGLNGWIRNESYGVELELEGESDAIEAFVAHLKARPPRLAVIEALRVESCGALKNYQGFAIRSSEKRGENNTLISPDVGICEDCLRELRDPGDRRYRYPFLNCTNCGPRFTIIRDVPYDRPLTSMGAFPMCGQCETEYRDIGNRRYHAQPNCCPACGPQVYYLDREGQTVEGDAIALAQQCLREQGIVAVKGLGGFHLACKIDREETLRELRRRKHRDEKPFALMCSGVEAVRTLCELSPQEEQRLTSYRRPIVLLRKKNGVSPYLSENRDLGVMLPYTPLHYLLMEGFDALVMTSANRSDCPVMYDNREALEHLKGIADGFLMHNRDIVTRCDDSLLRVFDGKDYFLRRSRGYAPQPLFLQADCTGILACGAEQKASFALSKGRAFFLSQHIGDLKNVETLSHYEGQIAHFQRLFGVQVDRLVCDLHPDYFSTAYALARSGEEGLPLIQVQHHHAHMASCMADNALEGPCIGVIWDGTGYGADGTIWGGEFLAGDYQGFQRLGSLRPIPLAGGDRAVKEISRVAFALLLDAGCPERSSLSEEKGRLLEKMISGGLNSPRASSMGRLFDGVYAILTGRAHVTYEGQGAILLETMAEVNQDHYPVVLEASGGRMDWDFRPMVRELVRELDAGTAPEVLAAKFMNTVVELARVQCQQIRERTGLHQVVLSGGVFQNMYLLPRVIRRLEEAGFEVYHHSRVSANDEGISLGQTMIAAKGGGQHVLGNSVSTGSN